MSTTESIVTADRIEKIVALDAPRSRVWRALTTVEQFNQWFGVGLTSPFEEGAEVTGLLQSKTYGDVQMHIWIESLRPESYFAFRWHPFALEKDVDYTAEPTTLVSFTLEDADGGTRLTIVESGFDAIPESRRARAFAANRGGWDAQAKRIAAYLAG